MGAGSGDNGPLRLMQAKQSGSRKIEVYCFFLREDGEGGAEPMTYAAHASLFVSMLLI